MTVKGRYEAVQGYFVIDFFDEPIFELVTSDVGKMESWAMFTHGVCAVIYGGGPLRFHRIGIPEDRMEKPGKDGLAERLEKAALILGYMGNNGNRHAPGNFTSQQCLLASAALSKHHDILMRECLEAYRSATGRSL